MIPELISVIVPVYNVEKYLSRCIESIISQTYDNIEILLINDGSTDNSGSICEEYALKESRIKVIHKENGGLSDARNVGLKNANGEFVIFIDSDDFIDKNMLLLLLNSIKENNSDISICNFDYFFENGDIKETEMLINDSISGYEATKLLLDSLSPQMVVAWNKLEKISLWNDFSFPKGKQHEDDFTTFRLLFNSNKISFVNIPLYHYYQRADSIIGVGFNEKSLHKIEAYECAMNYFREKDTNFYNRCTNIVLIMIKKCCDEAMNSSHIDKKNISRNLKRKGRIFYIKNFYRIKRNLKYHLKLIKFLFFV